MREGGRERVIFIRERGMKNRGAIFLRITGWIYRRNRNLSNKLDMREGRGRSRERGIRER
jgi:hypothetical protein